MYENIVQLGKGPTMWKIIIIFLIFMTITYAQGFQQGFDYAKDIALGKRKVKPSKDFMNWKE